MILGTGKAIANGLALAGLLDDFVPKNRAKWVDFQRVALDQELLEDQQDSLSSKVLSSLL